MGIPLSGSTVNKTTTVNFGVLPQAFRDAILADEARSTQWTTVRDVVFVCTRQLRAHGYYPEKVLVAIKTAVRYAASEVLSEKATEDIVSSAAQSCIDFYFDVVENGGGETHGHRMPVAIPRGVTTPGATEITSMLKSF
ncbi:MAG TPA: hypothetical protein VFP26_04690 [Gemmatimonadaceae bacterium]|nr:hypothetical protein [Gemmatimonadaceae bacterium]